MSVPGLSWDAALRMAGVELEQITDINIHEFLELGIKGGISILTHRREVLPRSITVLPQKHRTNICQITTDQKTMKIKNTCFSLRW
jgi:hypothetical protein